eukprot:CAMPEP_0184864074 /NCGR_PEP_ID=MMETSP0580-20130426/13620_1 /TAXON_ID=1118495 /ORGANISM="Dactyliosolen fragilissimus" /LENGTH=440 /DNA_ID=CAMNT_0027362711 /DNA_START=348 /DNA_END=1667 /DNA_ORIENTATION=-
MARAENLSTQPIDDAICQSLVCESQGVESMENIDAGMKGREKDLVEGSRIEVGVETNHAQYGSLASIALKNKQNSKLVVKDRKFEYAELCRIFLGNVGESSYLFSVVVNFFLQLWGYTAVFSSAMAVVLPLRHDFDQDYRLYTFAYAIVVVPLSCIELKEQVVFQMIMSCCRFMVISLMILTIFSAISDQHTVSFKGIDLDSPHSPVPISQLSNFYEMFSVLVFTTLFHNGIPVLAKPIADKSKVAHVMRDAIVVVGFACWLLGMIAAYYFGPNIAQSSNLNWNAYVGGTGRPSNCDNSGGYCDWIGVSIWAIAIRFFIVCIPAFNVLSAYPLNAIVLGNNILSGISGSSDLESNKFWNLFFRLIASIPPIIGALFVKDLGIITSYTGVLSQMTALTFPSLLYIKSNKMIFEKYGHSRETYYDGLGSSDVCAWTIFYGSI